MLMTCSIGCASTKFVRKLVCLTYSEWCLRVTQAVQIPPYVACSKQMTV